MDFKPLIFISGKGGTGKTTLSMFLCRQLAVQGKKVLFVELAARSSAAPLAGVKPSPAYQPATTPWGFDWSLVRGMDCLIEYVSSFTGVQAVTQKVFETSVIKTLVNVAPGLNDLSVLGKLTSHHRQHGPGFDYDHVVVDAHSTGSFHSLLQAPVLLGQSVTAGPLKTQSEEIDKILKNKNLVQYFFVCLPEELPVDELEDTLSEFNDRIGEQCSVIMNKAMPSEPPTLGNDSWKQFVNSRISEQQHQVKRLEELWPRRFQVELMTTTMGQRLKDFKGDLLRPI